MSKGSELPNRLMGPQLSVCWLSSERGRGEKRLQGRGDRGPLEGSESHARRVSSMQRAGGHAGSSAGVSWSQDVSGCVCWVVQGEREGAKRDTFP